MLRTLLLGLAVLFSSVSYAQYGDFGLPEQPHDTTAVDDLIFYGEMLDMSGGYNVGDTVYNFTVYDFDGNSVTLYDELAGPKPVLLLSGSVSCLRYRDTFEIGNNSQEYLAVRNFFDEYKELFNIIFIYGIEAHPTDGNCPSNCPTTTSNDTTVVQAVDYHYRRWALKTWQDSPEHEFEFPMYADNPDNAVYNNFFQRPYGMLAINCNGTVEVRADWMNSFCLNQDNIEALVGWTEGAGTCVIDWQGEEEEEEEEGEGEEEGEEEGEGNNEGEEEEEEEEGEGEEEEEEEEDDDPVVVDIDPNSLDGDGDDSVVSVEDITTRPFSLFPNPSNGQVSVAGLAGTGLLTITDMNGRMIDQQQINGTFVQLDLSNLANGSYIISIQEEGKLPKRERLILR
ncbi:T9SS type A sorting domain-containing protein [Sanyastnella coralliicola]|uniref:T9SS type A sorting domain-containing protein n=1 Tax=Sanyastnella coralliicola TaxID=3069118 RepID=UPI0027B9C6E0|nr:T9SS type A sorting domain-containing protein [Longitalea sp. SCSIO 12813]